METMNRRSLSEPEVLVSGRKLGLSALASIVAAAGVGIITYYCLASTMGGVLGTALPQIVTFAVYAALLAVLCYSFRPPVALPLRFALPASRTWCSQSVQPSYSLPPVRSRMHFSVCFLEASRICSRN